MLVAELATAAAQAERADRAAPAAQGELAVLVDPELPVMVPEQPEAMAALVARPVTAAVVLLEGRVAPAESADSLRWQPHWAKFWSLGTFHPSAELGGRA